MDNDFDGFMKTLDDLNKKEAPSDTDKQSDYASSFDVDIDDLFSSKSLEFETKPEPKPNSDNENQNENENEMKIATYSMKSVDSNKTGEFASMHNQFMQSIKEIKDLTLSQDTIDINVSISTPKLSVDTALHQLLEPQPEHDDTVELSISDMSDSQITLQNIDDLESIASQPTHNNHNNHNNDIKHCDSDSNAPEYDLEAFGIKETTQSAANKQASLRTSLPSKSSFDTHPKSLQTVHILDSIHSNISSIASTPHSKKSTLSNENRGDLTKLKLKIKSHKKNKTNNPTNTTNAAYKTPMSKKNINTFIQTPRHSLKISVENSRANSKSSSLACSPSAKHKSQHQLDEKDNIIKQLQANIQEITKEFEREKIKIRENADIKIKDAESKTFAIECKLKAMPRSDTQNMSKEIESMDRIICGLNAENAKLSKQLKEQKIDLRQSQQIMYKENQKINNNLISTQQQLTDMTEDKICELQPAAFNEIQRLRKELNDINKTNNLRQRELGLEINKLKQHNVSLQFKLNGMDKQTFDDESDIIKQFKTETLKIQKKSQQQIDELQRKLKWYIENQQLIKHLNEEIKSKNEEIISLKSSQSQSLSQSPKENKYKLKPNANEHRQIVSLKKKVSDLERLLSSKHPDSIANLITIMKGGDNNVVTQQLREEVGALKKELDNTEDATLSRLRGLRQENDKIILQLNTKINNLRNELKKSKRDLGFIRPNIKIKQLEKQIADLKKLHSKKINKLLADKKTSKLLKDKKANNKKNDIKFENEMETLHMKLNQKEVMVNNLQMMVETEKHKHNDLKQQISSLRTQLKNLINKHNKSDTKEIIVDIDNNDCKVDIVDSENNYKMSGDMEEREKIYIEKIAILESAINGYKEQSKILHGKLSLEQSKGEQSVKAVKNELEWNKLEKAKALQVINKLEFELNHAKNIPTYIEYQTLLIKLEKIEGRNSSREKELEQTYMRLIQTNTDCEQELTDKYNVIIAKKDNTIQSLQNELTVLMTAFDKIQSSS